MALKITDAAKIKIVEVQTASAGRDLVACIGWVRSGVKMWFDRQGNENSAPIPSHWGLGFYERDDLSPNDITQIDGISIMKDDSLDGKTLDYQDGVFHVY